MRRLIFFFAVGVTAACTIQVTQGGECCCVDGTSGLPDAGSPWVDPDAGWYGGTGGGTGGWLPPNVMFLVDKSGSMSDQLTPGCSTGCPDGGVVCGVGCETRFGAVQSGMSLFLDRYGARLPFGLAVFPSDNTCGPTNSVLMPLPPPGSTPTYGAYSQQMKTVLLTLLPAGGTPTGASLAFLGASPQLNDPLDGRGDVVVLLTDGVPNCNPGNPHNACTGDVGACRCTLSSCAGAFCANGCLDDQGTVAAIQTLQSRSIRVFVVGVGPDTLTGDAPAVLNAMAAAGGFPLTCPGGTDGECGAGNTCNRATFHCAREYRQANNAIELAAVLAGIADTLLPPGP